MKTKIVTILMAVILSTVVCTGCIDPKLPVYEKTETEEDGICVVIDGVKYKELPKLKWEISQTNFKRAGYAGDYKTLVLMDSSETEKNFIILRGSFAGSYVCCLYRTDKMIPDMSSESVDKIVLKEYIGLNPQEDDVYLNTVIDKEAIKELFDSLNSEEKIDDYQQIVKDSEYYNIDIILYSTQLTGAYYYLETGMNDGRFICGKPNIKYVYISDDLLEKLAGKQINDEELFPIYRRIYENGFSFDVNGVMYSDLPYIRWKVDTTNAEIIGYAGGKDVVMMSNPEDTEKNFVFLKDYSAEGYHDNCCLRRTDKDLPNVEAQSVDKIVWEDNISGKTYTNMIEDKKTIEDLFFFLDNGINESVNADENPVTDISIKLYCSDLPGAYFPLNLGLHNNRIFCEDVSRTNTVYLPFSLLEDMAGKKLEGILY